MDIPWALLAGKFLLVVFLDAVLDGEWIFAFGMVLSALGAGSYYLYVEGGRADRRLNLVANVLTTIGVIVLVAALAFFD